MRAIGSSVTVNSEGFYESMREGAYRFVRLCCSAIAVLTCIPATGITVANDPRSTNSESRRDMLA